MNLEGQAMLVSAQVLVAAREEVRPFPAAEADNVPHVSAIVWEAVERRPEIA